ncbi:hypothetical protein DF121_34185 [Burkholderia stagnalis]|nr:hypothetical protein DF145_33610 [Burkholderia stagnalis]RQX87133.1 hypothetical protein DF121_34185 [Burkholderia stagnalis]RQY07221.1 hypothetical protein DF115_34215 [Burkholderia stagnalis]RQY22287.1 hypothetical protein DF114_34025 [Burkholderia stagnalis]
MFLRGLSRRLRQSKSKELNMMTRSETLFQIGYSIRLEKMQAMFLVRTDRFVNFAQILLGAAVITTAAPVATGIAVAALAAFSFIYQPGAKSIQALAQKQKYEQLFACASSISDEQLFQKYCALQETDSQVIGSLMNPAHMGELVRLGETPDFQLTWLERIFAFIAGDLPRPN